MTQTAQPAEAAPITSLAQITDGGEYELRDGVYVRVKAPTAPAHRGAHLVEAEQEAEGRQGAAVGAAIGAPPAAPEALPTDTAKAKR